MLFNELITRYRTSGVLVDTNILLLLFVGNVNPELIPKFKRTKQFTIEDYSTLVNLLEWFDVIVTTPNILSEVSSLSNQLRQPLKDKYFESFAHSIKTLQENYIESSVAAGSSNFVKFGLTDSTIIQATKNKTHLVITDDFSLSNLLNSQGIDAINFNHIRTQAWH